MQHLKHFSFLMVFLVLSSSTFGQNRQLEHIYYGYLTHKENSQKPLNVFYKLTLNTDSSFTYTKNTKGDDCLSTYAGYWRINKNTVILESIGEDPIAFNYSEKDNTKLFLADDDLILKSANLIIENSIFQKKPKADKKQKEPPCPKF